MMMNQLVSKKCDMKKNTMLLVKYRDPIQLLQLLN